MLFWVIREHIDSRLTRLTLARASPRKPKVLRESKSWSSFSLEVANRVAAKPKSTGWIPQPLSDIESLLLDSTWIDIEVLRMKIQWENEWARAKCWQHMNQLHSQAILYLFASREFSRSSLTTLAGLWTTSPAAIRSTTCFGKAWIAGVAAIVIFAHPHCTVTNDSLIFGFCQKSFLPSRRINHTPSRTDGDGKSSSALFEYSHRATVSDALCH